MTEIIIWQAWLLTLITLAIWEPEAEGSQIRPLRATQ